ncbi:MAG: hypothetical protein H7841_16490 [Magnetospirillum sp. WYHS-4]
MRKPPGRIAGALAASLLAAISLLAACVTGAAPEGGGEGKGASSGAAIALTGHSLGGALAQYVWAKDYRDNSTSSPISSVSTFGAPGIKEFLVTDSLYDPALDVRVVGYFDKADPIGQNGTHLGVRVSVREVSLFEAFGLVVPGLSEYLKLEAHKMPVSASDAFYDFDNDGWREHRGWVGAGDGLLAYDANRDGFIQGRDELSFLGYREGARTDLEGLVAFDSNHDGRLDASDAAWADMKVWRDANGDGMSQAGEVVSLAEAAQQLDLERGPALTGPPAVPGIEQGELFAFHQPAHGDARRHAREALALPCRSRLHLGAQDRLARTDAIALHGREGQRRGPGEGRHLVPSGRHPPAWATM